MSTRNIIVIGGSAGAIQGVIELLSHLPAHLDASLFVTIHVSAHSPSLLAHIFQKSTGLAVVDPEDNQRILPGRVYVAPPNRHLLVKPGRVRVIPGPHENGHRPAIDPLFRTAAFAYGSRVIGILLSGNLDDGSRGLIDIKKRGGLALVQSPEEAQFPDMPRNAIQSAHPDLILSLRELTMRLSSLVEAPAKVEVEGVRDYVDKSEGQGTSPPLKDLGPPSPFICPQCGGPLWERSEGDLLRYECHVGHSYTAESLTADNSSNLESALWLALRMLEESAALARRLARRAEERGQTAAAQRYRAQVDDRMERATIIRRALFSGNLAAPGTPPEIERTDEA